MLVEMPKYIKYTLGKINYVIKMCICKAIQIFLLMHTRRRAWSQSTQLCKWMPPIQMFTAIVYNTISTKRQSPYRRTAESSK